MASNNIIRRYVNSGCRGAGLARSRGEKQLPTPRETDEQKAGFLCLM
jgi:hypothetical protein